MQLLSFIVALCLELGVSLAHWPFFFAQNVIIIRGIETAIPMNILVRRTKGRRWLKNSAFRLSRPSAVSSWQAHSNCLRQRNQCHHKVISSPKAVRRIAAPRSAVLIVRCLSKHAFLVQKKRSDKGHPLTRVREAANRTSSRQYRDHCNCPENIFRSAKGSNEVTN